MNTPNKNTANEQVFKKCSRRVNETPWWERPGFECQAPTIDQFVITAPGEAFCYSRHGSIYPLSFHPASGDIYGLTCSCPGFRSRRVCRHTAGLVSSLIGQWRDDIINAYGAAVSAHVIIRARHEIGISSDRDMDEAYAVREQAYADLQALQAALRTGGLL